MRVIAGTARRINLKTPDGLDTRPTQDRIKETLFNIAMQQGKLFSVLRKIWRRHILKNRLWYFPEIIMEQSTVFCERTIISDWSSWIRPTERRLQKRPCSV